MTAARERKAVVEYLRTVAKRVRGTTGDVVTRCADAIERGDHVERYACDDCRDTGAVQCVVCGGSGAYVGERCPVCAGDGRGACDCVAGETFVRAAGAT